MSYVLITGKKYGIQNVTKLLTMLKYLFRSLFYSQFAHVTLTLSSYITNSKNS